MARLDHMDSTCSCIVEFVITHVTQQSSIAAFCFFSAVWLDSQISWDPGYDVAAWLLSLFSSPTTARSESIFYHMLHSLQNTNRHFSFHIINCCPQSLLWVRFPDCLCARGCWSQSLHHPWLSQWSHGMNGHWHHPVNVCFSCFRKKLRSVVSLAGSLVKRSLPIRASNSL